jgi:hypothetical protein
VLWNARSVALVIIDVSEEGIASTISVTKIGKLGTTLVITSNQRTLLRNTRPIDGSSNCGLNRLCGLVVKSSWLPTQRSRVRFPALPDFLSSSGSRTGSTQPS